MVQRVFKYCLLSAIVFITVLGHAQQQPLYTQYMFNGLVLNPAYAGSQETFTATALFRTQWAGIEDSPQTQTVSAHSPLDKLRNKRRPDSKVSVGLTLFNDRIAITDDELDKRAPAALSNIAAKPKAPASPSKNHRLSLVSFQRGQLERLACPPHTPR